MQVGPATLRGRPTLASPIVGELGAGRLVEVVEAAVNPAGHTRLCCYHYREAKAGGAAGEEAGWASMHARDGRRLLRPETLEEADAVTLAPASRACVGIADVMLVPATASAACGMTAAE